MEVALPLLWFFDGVSFYAAVVIYAVHRLEMPEYPVAFYQPLLRGLSTLSQFAETNSGDESH